MKTWRLYSGDDVIWMIAPQLEWSFSTQGEAPFFGTKGARACATPICP